ncbi:hypothetical protein EXS65_02035 [Candidatus Peribacteria bacterium]|nr:hypothetical protein [Candidatus Peribacteria bacterium]
MSAEDLMKEWAESVPKNHLKYHIRSNEEAKKKAAWIIFEAFKDSPDALKKYRGRLSKGNDKDLEETLYAEILRQVQENDVLIWGPPMDARKNTTENEVRLSVVLTRELCWSHTHVWLPRELLIQGSDPRNLPKTMTAEVMKQLRKLLGMAGIRW